MYKIVVFVPGTHKELVKDSVFKEGAGTIGDYDSCCWETKGMGQFRPLAGSNPYVGTRGRVETVEEYRVEMVCADESIEAVIKAMKQAHPYEEPAIDVFKLYNME